MKTEQSRIRSFRSILLLALAVFATQLADAATIGDKVWNDANLNGRQDGGEAGISGVNVTLETYIGPASPTSTDFANPSNWSTTGNPTTVSVSAGAYSFTGLAVGYYRVKFDLPANYLFTAPNQVNDATDSDADQVSGYTAPVDINSVGLVNSTVDAGMYLDPTVLPVSLTSFSVTSGEANAANLNWSTVQEVNSDYFIVERSSDTKSWTEVARVAASRNSDGRKDYQYTDLKPGKGLNYYRLKMVDLDASFAFSIIRQFSMSTGNLRPEVISYPNPVSDRLFVQNQGEAWIVEAKILDQSGRVAMVAKSSDVASGIDVKRLVGGMYVLHISLSDGTSQSRKVKIVR